MKKLIPILILLLTTCLYSTIINVPGDQPTIQDGIVAAADTDTVLVADGTYYENIDFIGKAIAVASNFLIDADTLHIENTIINGSQPDDPDYGSCASFMSGEDTTSVITGFTLTEGSGTFYSGLGNCGGGIVCDNSSPKIVSNIVTNNSADYSSGVGIVNNSSPILLSNVISYNTAAFNSGGVSIYTNCDAYLEGNIISNNTANSGVGGILISESSPTIVSNVIRENSALGSSGGVYIQLDSSPLLLNNIICNNTSETESAGLGVYAGSGTSTTTIENCLIYGNTSGFNGGGIWVYDANIDVINCTISDNHADTNGGGVFVNVNANADLVNSILWNDSPQEIYIASGAVTATYSDIQGGWAGEGNIDEDPLFFDPVNNDFHLTELSPCIDAGDPNSPPDPDGTIADMGRFYFHQTGTNENTIVQTEDYLKQNYPNPFNPITTICYQLPENGKVELTIYNLKGQKVKTLVNDQLSAGQHSIVWNGTDENNKPVSSGIYFYKLKATNFEKTRKMILMK